MLTQNLRPLEAEGIVARRDMSDLVLHIEYEPKLGLLKTIGAVVLLIGVGIPAVGVASAIALIVFFHSGQQWFR